MVNKAVVDGVSYDSVRVASLNLLNNEDSFLSSRLPHLRKELVLLDADVVMFQEVLVGMREPLSEMMSGLGYELSHFARPCLHPRSPSSSNGTAVFSRVEGTVFSEIAFRDPYGTGLDDKLMSSAVAVFSVKGSTFHAVSNHFAWGGGAERFRLTQAKQITEYAAEAKAADSSAVIVLGGDLNATAESDSIRYLKGLDADSGSDFAGRDMWIDCWEVAGDDSSYVTSNGSDFWGSVTASRVGIKFPELLPKRRIDYIMVFGWAYGRAGSPLTFERFADKLTGDENEVSDHYGVSADLLVL